MTEPSGKISPAVATKFFSALDLFAVCLRTLNAHLPRISGAENSAQTAKFLDFGGTLETGLRVENFEGDVKNIAQRLRLFIPIFFAFRQVGARRLRRPSGWRSVV